MIVNPVFSDPFGNFLICIKNVSISPVSHAAPLIIYIHRYSVSSYSIYIQLYM